MPAVFDFKLYEPLPSVFITICNYTQRKKLSTPGYIKT